MNNFWPIPDCRVEQVTPDNLTHHHIAARGLRRGCCCPDCGRTSRAVHSRYDRHPADLPSLGRTVSIHLRVRRFYCRNTACPRQTFAERLPNLVAPFARRTRRQAEAQGQTGAALGGEAGARLLAHLSMPASADTVLRLIKATPLPDQPVPRVVGVDDWAKRKGSRYGTIIVDLERHRVVDLLPDRSAATLADWLRQRPGIEIVARDRSTEYASGIAAGAPAAVQVANRWHLLANMRQVVDRWFTSVHGRLRRLPGVQDPVGVLSGQPTGGFPRSASDAQVGLDNRARRLALYEEVRRRHGAGEALIAIARSMKLARGTVHQYARAEDFPERAMRRPGHSIIDPHLAYLQARLAEGCEDAAALWREIRGQVSLARPNRYGAGSASDGQNRPGLRPTAGGGEYQLIRRPPAARHRGYHHPGNLPGYSCNLLPCWPPPTPRPSPGSSKTTTLQSSRNWRAGSPLSSARAAPAKRQISIRPLLI